MTVALLGLAHFDAAAQWYVFPGSRKKHRKTETVTAPLPSADTVMTAAADKDSLETEHWTEPVIPECVRVSLILPFRNRSGINSGMMDFYCGALLAARKKGNDGVDVELSVFDCSGYLAGVPYALGNSDVILGPVGTSDISAVLQSCPPGKFIVSPLDPQAASLVDSCNIIQVPASNERQTDGMLDWLKEDLADGDRVVVVRESGETGDRHSNLLVQLLSSRGIEYTTISYGILQGLQIFTEFENRLAPEGCTTRYLIASESESFTGDAVRNVALMLHRGHQVALYGTSRTRSFASIEAEDFHELGFKAVTSYHIDYSDAKVKDFVLSYRTLFGCEPSAFAFSGFDTAEYFITAVSTLGTGWAEHIHSFARSGLQADFDFEPVSGGGTVNNAVRRIVYNPDLTTTIVK